MGNDSVLALSTSRVGIGTASPNYKLEVSSAADTDATVVTTSNSNSAVLSTFNSHASSGNFLQLRSYGAGTSGTIFGNSIAKANMLWSNVDNLFAIGTIGATPLIFGTENAERMRITSAGNVGIGTSAPTSLLNLSSATPILTLNQTTANSEQGIEFDFSDTNYAYIRANSLTGLVSYAAGLTGGAGYFHRFIVDGSERFRITPNGVTFNGDTAAANALDDYEEGTWSPQVYYQNATDQANATNVTQVGSYTKIGRLVTITCVLQWTITGSPAADNIGVKNLPFTSTTGADLIWFGPCQMVNAGGYPTDGYKIYMNQNSSLVLLYDDRSDAGNYGLTVGASGTKTLRFSFTYSAS